MPDHPLYQGARLNIAGSTPRPIETPDLTSQAASRASANAAAGLEGIINDFVKIKDFGTSQQQETRLREINAGFEAEADRRMALAPGHEQSLFDENGILIPSAIDDLVHEYSSQINDLPGAYINPETGLHASSIRQSVADNLRSNLYSLATKKQIQLSRQSAEENLSLAQASKDWNGFIGSVNAGEQAGIFSTTKANELRYTCNQERLSSQLEKGMLKDPQKAMLDITRGKYDDLEATTRARMTKACERALSTDCKQIAFTSEERRKIREGGVVTPKFEVRNGATKQEYEWRKYFNEHGTYDRYKNDIKDSWINEINNAPVPEDKEDAESWIKYMVKKYCDPKTGYQVNEYELTTMAKQKMQGLLGLGNKEKGVDVRAYLERLEDRTLVPNAYNYLEQRKGESYMTSDRRKRFEGEARDIIEQRRREIRNDVAVAMSKWRAIHPDATYDKEMEQLSDFVQVYSRTHDSDIPELGTEYKKLAQDDAKKQKQMIHDATAGEDLRNTEGTAGIDTQRKMYDSYMKEQKPYFPEPSVATANNIFEVSSIQSDEAAVYLPAEQFKAIQKKLGNVPMARVTLPGTKAWVEVPVKQGDVQDVSISDSALVRMNNVRAKQAYIQFTAGDGSKPVNNEDKTSSMIFDNEARLDSNGNLTVYKLPAGDGGGTHEIAGINNGSHPQEFAKLKKMLDAGNQEEAKQEAKRYIAEKTQPVGNILQYAGVKSSGIDYFLRDMYFNSGEYGAMRVIHRALGIKDSDTKKFNQETINVLKNYIQTHSESQLLDKLKEARERLYKSIAANNPQKEKFLAGWLNRNTRVYKQAGKMA